MWTKVDPELGATLAGRLGLKTREAAAVGDD
jgi:hypothetical protein